MTRYHALLYFMLGLFAASVHAQVTSTTGTASTSNLIIGQDNAVTVTWTVISNLATIPVTVTSSNGQLTDAGSGAFLANIGASLRQSQSPPSPNPPYTFTFVETIIIPAVVIQQAVNNQATGIRYDRLFQDQQGGFPGNTVPIFNLINPPFTIVSQGIAANPRISAGSFNRVQIQWVFNITSAVGAAAPGPVTIESAGGFLDPELQAVNTALSQTFTFAPNSNTLIATISETLSVSSALTYTMLKNKLASVTYTRNFSANGQLVFASTNLFLGSADANGPLTVHEMNLRFSDDRLVKVVPSGDALTAKALILYSGSGTLSGQWRYRALRVSGGNGSFIPLQTVTQPLMSGQSAVLTSPALPTTMTGHYQLQFHLTQPAPASNEPVLNYSVEVQKQPKLVLLNPVQNAIYSKQTLFRWKAAKKAVSYEIAIFPLSDAADNAQDSKARSEDQAKAVAGALLPNTQTSYQLPQAALQKLRSKQLYRWRVIAYDGKGDRIAASEFRKVYLFAKPDKK